jgi:hypothetical protein
MVASLAFYAVLTLAFSAVRLQAYCVETPSGHKLKLSGHNGEIFRGRNLASPRKRPQRAQARKSTQNLCRVWAEVASKTDEKSWAH